PWVVAVSVDGVLPLLLSALLAPVAAFALSVHAALPVLAAAAAVVVVPALGAESVTVKASSASTVVSPATLMVTSLLVSPAAKLTVPLGNAAPVKSAAVAALAPLPATVYVADDAPVVSPEPATVNPNGVLPLLPSA